MVPPWVVSLDLGANSLKDIFDGEKKTVSVSLENSALQQISIAGNQIDGWEICKILMDKKPMLYSLRVSENIFYNHPAARQVLIAAFPNLTILNGAPVDKPSLRINASRYCAASKDIEKLRFLSEKRLAELRQEHPPPPEVAVDAELGQLGGKKKSGMQVKIFPLEGKTGKATELTVLPSLTLGAFRRLVAKRGGWPLDVADLEISWRQVFQGGDDDHLDGSDWNRLDMADSENLEISEKIDAEKITVLLAVKGK